MMNCKLIDIKNKYYGFFQAKFEKIAENSFILSKIDDIIFFFISLTLFASTFLESEKIGAFAIVVILLTIIKLYTKKGAKVAMTSWDGALTVYFIICFMSTINSTLLPQSIHGFLKTIIYIFYYFCAVNYFQTNKNKIRYIFMLVGCLCFVEGIIAIFQNFAGVEQISTWQDSNYINPEDTIARAYGTLKPYNPNLLGGYLLAGIPFILGAGAICLTKKSYKTFFSSLAVVLICSLAVFFTGSRGAYLGLGAIIAGLIFITTKIIYTNYSDSPKLKALWTKATVGIFAMFALVLIAVPKILKRLLSIFILRGDSSTSFRMNVYNSSWQMFQDNWILGIGSGNQTFREIYGLYMLTGFDALSTYSVPLEIAVESGIFGLIAFASFIILFLIKAYNFIVCKADNCTLAEKITVGAATLTILGVMAHGIFDTIYFRPQVQFLFWTMVAIGSSILINFNSMEKE